MLIGLLGLPQAVAQTAVRERISLDEDWKFHFGHAGDPSKDFNFKVANIFSKTGRVGNTPLSPGFNDSTWRTLDVPHDWAVELPFQYMNKFDVMAHGYKPVGGLFPETSVGWYRKEFKIESDSGARFAVTFDGIFRDAMVWLNGFYLGNNESGYMGVTYDMTDYVNFGGKNVLVVRVDASQYEGWFYEGAGIYRHVWLEKFNNLHISNSGGVFVHTKVVNDKKATVNVETILQNQTLHSAEGSVYAYVTDRNGKKLAESSEEPASVGLNGHTTLRQQLTVDDPRLWSLDDPYLYRVHVVVESDGKVVDQMTERFGIRTIEIDQKKGVLLNGEPVKIQGVNCHQDHAGVGSALPDYLQYYRIRKLKELGVNAYRASHNPPTPELLEACDSLGMLVMDETRLLNTSPEHMDQFERLIRRDRNHPSVFMWCIGNEEGHVQTKSVGKRLVLTMLAKQRELDPTRTSTYAADLANVYKGINEVIPVRGFNYREKGMVPYHNDHPNQPVVGTEMGSTVTTRGIYEVDSVRGYLPDQDLNHPWWASLAEDWWPIAAENEWLMGGFIWTGFDYRGEPTPFSWPNVNSHFGILDMCGFPKNIAYYYKSWWTNEDVLHISPHWNWAGKEGENIDVWVNTNADKVELFLNGKSLGEKKMPRNSHLRWEVPYEPGQLKAIAIKKGIKFEKIVETTGEAYEIILSPDREMMLADGTDATVIDVTVVDSKGREVPTANNMISFALEGDAEIIGVGNGDPSSHEADKASKRSLFNGKCQMILQAGEQPDTVKITATSPGLKTARIVINTVKGTTNFLGTR